MFFRINLYPCFLYNLTAGMLSDSTRNTIPRRSRSRVRSSQKDSNFPASPFLCRTGRTAICSSQTLSWRENPKKGCSEAGFSSSCLSSRFNNFHDKRPHNLGCSNTDKAIRIDAELDDLSRFQQVSSVTSIQYPSIVSRLSMIQTSTPRQQIAAFHHTRAAPHLPCHLKVLGKHCLHKPHSVLMSFSPARRKRTEALFSEECMGELGRSESSFRWSIFFTQSITPSTFDSR